MQLSPRLSDGAGAAGSSLPSAPVYSIDVEAVATGLGHNDRAVAQISLVDMNEQVLLNVYVKPAVQIFSYLTPLNGLTQPIIDTYGMPLEQAVAVLRQFLPPNATIVGQNIRKDIEWLGLVEGKDYGSLVDLAGLYRIWNPQYKSFSVFGQDHLAKVLLGWETPPAHVNGMSSHDAVRDAVKSMRLYTHHLRLKSMEGAWDKATEAVLTVPPAPSFARENPTFEASKWMRFRFSRGWRRSRGRLVSAEGAAENLKRAQQKNDNRF